MMQKAAGSNSSPRNPSTFSYMKGNQSNLCYSCKQRLKLLRLDADSTTQVHNTWLFITKIIIGDRNVTTVYWETFVGKKQYVSTRESFIGEHRMHVQPIVRICEIHPCCFRECHLPRNFPAIWYSLSLSTGFVNSQHKNIESITIMANRSGKWGLGTYIPFTIKNLHRLHHLLQSVCLCQVPGF